LETQPLLRDRQFRIALAIVVVIIALSVGNYLRLWEWRFPVGPFASTHWLGWVGGVYVAISTPIYSYMRRHSTVDQKKLFTTHIFGNLIAFLLISIHYTQQIGRTGGFKAVHSTGLILFIIVSTIVATGFIQRFGIVRSLSRYWRFIHVSLTLSFYIVIVTHILQALQIL
jgi:hypothetical protein